MPAELEKLTWSDLRRLGKSDSAGRWYPSEEVKDYFSHIRSPSRAYPNSYAYAAMTLKFLKWLRKERPELAAKFIKEPT
jgi:hypothetical protein